MHTAHANDSVAGFCDRGMRKDSRPHVTVPGSYMTIRAPRGSPVPMRCSPSALQRSRCNFPPVQDARTTGTAQGIAARPVGKATPPAATTVTRLPNRGLGVVASRDIRRGEVLLKEPPVIRITPDIGGPIAKWFGDPERARQTLSCLSRSAGSPLTHRDGTKRSAGSIRTRTPLELRALVHHRPLQPPCC